VQDRASAAVYGMPGEALRLDAAMLVLQPARIGKMLHTIANQPGALAALGL
jgi:two-component system chemotaxis response regulator CheB